MNREALLSRFWAQVEKSEDPNGCWLWTGRKTHGGHGFVVIVRNHTVKRAHRLAWEIHHNVTLPSNRLIGHTCGTKTCVNPEHLIVVKHAHWHIKGDK